MLRSALVKTAKDMIKGRLERYVFASVGSTTTTRISQNLKKRKRAKIINCETTSVDDMVIEDKPNAAIMSVLDPNSTILTKIERKLRSRKTSTEK